MKYHHYILLSGNGTLWTHVFIPIVPKIVSSISVNHLQRGFQSSRDAFSFLSQIQFLSNTLLFLSQSFFSINTKCMICEGNEKSFLNRKKFVCRFLQYQQLLLLCCWKWYIDFYKWEAVQFKNKINLWSAFLSK